MSHVRSHEPGSMPSISIIPSSFVANSFTVLSGNLTLKVAPETGLPVLSSTTLNLIQLSFFFGAWGGGGAAMVAFDAAKDIGGSPGMAGGADFWPDFESSAIDGSLGLASAASSADAGLQAVPLPADPPQLTST